MSETRSSRNTSESTARYSLINNGALDHDFRYTNAHGRTAREVVYVPGTPEQEHLRRVFMANGIVLGRETPTAAGHLAYEIPVQSRPLALEAPAPSHDEGVYGDKDLMYDLGELTARIHLLSGGIVKGPAESSFALTDLGPAGSHLYATPGIEKSIVPHDGADLLGAQMQQFSDEFGDKYQANVGDFVEGYMQLMEDNRG